jgi:hypothetical protein
MQGGGGVFAGCEVTEILHAIYTLIHVNADLSIFL